MKCMLKFQQNTQVIPDWQYREALTKAMAPRRSNPQRPGARSVQECSCPLEKLLRGDDLERLIVLAGTCRQTVMVMQGRMD
jgi:hypothetical protein